MLLELTGQEVFYGFIALAFILIVGIVFFRNINQNKPAQTTIQGSDKVISLANRTKYSNKSVTQHRSRILGLGLTFSLLFTLFAMSWTIYEREVPVLDIFKIEPEEIDVMPRTRQDPPPPPPPPKMKELIIEDVIDQEEDDLPDMTADISEPVSFDIPTPPQPSPLPPPPPLPNDEDEPSDIPFRIVEKNPMFGDCSDKSCSDMAFLKYMYKHISYPSIARENGIAGRVTAQFVIERNGQISDIKILRGIGAGCDQEVIDVLQKMNQGGPSWKPGEQRGKPVRVLYTLPVTYSLN